jgi:hypothetical protein
MNRLEQMYVRIEKRKYILSKGAVKDIKVKIKGLERIAVLFHACGDLTLLQAKKLSEELKN